MPVYEVECTSCAKPDEFVAKVSELHITPACSACGAPTKNVISAVRGFVYFPAAGGQGYVSPTSGKYIDSKRARTDDLKRSGCRPYEGFESESRQVAKDNAHEEKKSDEKLDSAVRQAYAQLSPEKRAVLE